MDKLSKLLPELKHKYSPEDLEKARIKQKQRAAQELGMCRWDCQICEGLGWVSDGSGKLQLCKNVDRWRLKSSDRIGITRDEYDELDWEYPIYHTGMSEAIEAVKSVMRVGYGWVYMHGGFGTGKTLLLKIAVAEAIRSGRDAAYTRMAEILDRLRAAFDEKKGESESARLEYWSDIDVLCIDEFDRIRGTAYTDERRFVLMDRRYEQACRRKSITIMASNDDPNKQPGYLYDRINDGRFTIVRITGDSMRPGMERE